MTEGEISDADLRRNDIITHHIDVRDSIPVKTRPYRTNPLKTISKTSLWLRGIGVNLVNAISRGMASNTNNLGNATSEMGQTSAQGIGLILDKIRGIGNLVLCTSFVH
jgi:hypothetical protein